MIKRTYVDSGVSITAARAAPELSEPAISVLTDPEREFVCSDWVKLEVLPKARFFRKTSELALYDLYFGRVAIWMNFTSGLVDEALQEASENGLSAVDAIHVVLAGAGGCQELITSEKPTSAIHRTRRIQVVGLSAERR